MAEFVIVHKDGHRLLGASSSWWYWCEPDGEMVRRYSREEAQDVAALVPWRIKRDVGTVREWNGQNQFIAPQQNDSKETT